MANQSANDQDNGPVRLFQGGQSSSWVPSVNLPRVVREVYIARPALAINERRFRRRCPDEAVKKALDHVKSHADPETGVQG